MVFSGTTEASPNKIAGIARTLSCFRNEEVEGRRKRNREEPKGHKYNLAGQREAEKFSNECSGRRLTAGGARSADEEIGRASPPRSQGINKAGGDLSDRILPSGESLSGVKTGLLAEN